MADLSPDVTADLGPDGGADAAAVMIDHLTAPLAAGAVRSVFAPAADGTVALPSARRPTLLVVLRRALDATSLVLTATLDGVALDALRFSPWSEAGSTLVLAGAGEVSAARALALAASVAGAALAPAAITDWVEIVMIEGTTGRVVTLLGAETVRLRREMGVLAAMRSLRHAGDDALDRVGTELAVPRLYSVPAWSAARTEIVSTPAREPDDTYRARLAVWRPFVAPTPAAIGALLADVDPRLSVTEPGDPLAIAIKLVGIGSDAPRQALLAHVRAERLVFLQNGGAGDAIHAARPMQPGRRTTQELSRARLTLKFPAAPDAAVAPQLADALDRAARILIALNGAPIPLTRAQDPAGGSRFELGLGATITLPAVADANALRTLLLDGARAATADAEAEAMIGVARATPPPAGDRTLAWLWQVAGLVTAHRLSADALYLSHLPTRGLIVETADTLPVATRGALRAVFNAPGDPGLTAALSAALDQATAAAPGTFTQIAEADTAAAIAPAVDLPSTNPAVSVLAGAGLPLSSRAAPTLAALTTLPAEIRVVLRLEAGLAANIRTGAPAAIPALAAVVAALRAGGVVSLLPLLTPADVLLVAGAAALPVAGVNLGERRTTGVRWSVESLGGNASVSHIGFRNTLAAISSGLVAVVALGYVRDGSPDPYEIRIDMPDGAVLDLAGYERVMNALERCYPVGVEVNTWSLRQRHVDLDGDGKPDPLPPTLARHYRRFRIPRMRGMEEPSEPDPSYTAQ